MRGGRETGPGPAVADLVVNCAGEHGQKVAAAVASAPSNCEVNPVQYCIREQKHENMNDDSKNSRTDWNRELEYCFC